MKLGFFTLATTVPTPVGTAFAERAAREKMTVQQALLKLISEYASGPPAFEASESRQWTGVEVRPD